MAVRIDSIPTQCPSLLYIANRAHPASKNQRSPADAAKSRRFQAGRSF
jgi:hypothetical protein